MVIETIFAEVYFELFENNSIKKYNLKAEYKIRNWTKRMYYGIKVK